MSAQFAIAEPRRIKATHRRRRKVTAGHFVRRYYDPQTGRFLSTDPAESEFNRYNYASNNPYRFTDPDGRASVGCQSTNSCPGQVVTRQETPVANLIASTVLDFTPGIGDAKGIYEAYQAPTATNISAAVVSVVPIVGDVAGKVIKNADNIEKIIHLSTKVHGEAASHAADAIKAGKPDVLTIARDGASGNRSASTGGPDKVSGKQLDEYPPAMFQEGGSGASVRAINPSNNMSAGACIGNACRGLPNVTQVKIVVDE